MAGTTSTKLEQLRAGRLWLAEHGSDSCLYVQPDPDGLATGALIAKRAVADVSFSDPYADQLVRTGPMIIVDQGVKPVHSRAAVLYVDHHEHPAKVRGTVVWDPEPPATSLLAWRLLEVPVENRWLAALGVLVREGEPALARHRLPEPAAPLRRIAQLCVAPTLLRGAPVRTSFAMLHDADGPRSALAGPQAAVLQEVRDTVRAYGQRAAAVPPRSGALAALVEIDVPARVHSQLASAWARRLAGQPVVVANLGWSTREVHYAIAGSDPERLSEFLATVNASRSGRRGQEPRYDTQGVLSLTAYERFAGLLLRRCVVS